MDRPEGIERANILLEIIADELLVARQERAHVNSDDPGWRSDTPYKYWTDHIQVLREKLK